MMAVYELIQTDVPKTNINRFLKIMIDTSKQLEKYKKYILIESSN